MRLATWSLERTAATGQRADRLRQIIRQVSADVWVLTETHSNLVPEDAALSAKIAETLYSPLISVEGGEVSGR